MGPIVWKPRKMAKRVKALEKEMYRAAKDLELEAT